VYICGSYLRKI